MISKKQEEDEQCSDLLQTVWSEYNIKGKEHLHAHVKNEKGKGYITDENFPSFLDILSFHLPGSMNTINIVSKIEKKIW